jgi:hypothetical protein
MLLNPGVSPGLMQVLPNAIQAKTISYHFEDYSKHGQECGGGMFNGRSYML